ncbi:MAG: hypothetical protein L3J04_11240 [Robiginitomaculum sp.]|nr:hypothetical protein [Robiginitomaculum sp.]
MATHKNLMNSLILMSVGNESAGKRATLDAARAMMNFAKDKATLGRATLTSILLATGLSTTACAQEKTAEQPAPAVASADEKPGVQYASLNDTKTTNDSDLFGSPTKPNLDDAMAAMGRQLEKSTAAAERAAAERAVAERRGDAADRRGDAAAAERAAAERRAAAAKAIADKLAKSTADSTN